MEGTSLAPCVLGRRALDGSRGDPFEGYRSSFSERGANREIRMSRNPLRRVALVLSALSLVAVTHAAQAQFGRNKVQYETFDWRILKTEHFDSFFYPAESLGVFDNGRMAERWYARFSDLFRHAFFGKSLIFYADHPDFEQTNVIQEQLEEGTGGVTESIHTRVIMPMTGVYADNSHVLGHELVHVFQYNIAEGMPGGITRMAALPLWLVEGMAEYLSLGRDNALTSMWMRDAVMRDKFPSIQQLTTDPRFFPYRYGQALWAYIGGKWGDRAIIEIYRSALRTSWDIALIRRLGMNADSLSKEWAQANKDLYLPIAQQRTAPDSAGQPIIKVKRSGDHNLAPALSPDGRYLTFFSSRGLFGLDLYLADAKTGKVIKTLASPTIDSHVDALSSINSTGDWSPDSKKFAFIVFADGNNEVAILDVASGHVERRIKLPGIGAVSAISWSPDGTTLAFATLVQTHPPHADSMMEREQRNSHLTLYDVASGRARDVYNQQQYDDSPGAPIWSADSKRIYFTAGDRAYTSVFVFDVASGTYRKITNHQLISGVSFSKDGSRAVMTINSPMEPAEVYVGDATFASPRKLTNMHPELANIALGETEVLTWKSSDGQEVEGVLLKPVGYQQGRRYPLLVEPHGGPTGAHNAGFKASSGSPGQFWAGRGWATFYPNPRGSTGYGEKFMRGNILDWGGGDYKDIMTGVDALIAKGVADPEKLAVAGWSYGGYMTSWVISQTQRFKAARMGAGLSDLESMYGTTDIPGYIGAFFDGPPDKKTLDLYRERSAITYRDRITTPTMIMHGAQDARVPIGQPMELFRALRDKGTPVELWFYPREGHGFSEYYHQIDKMNREYDWIAKYALGTRATVTPYTAAERQDWSGKREPPLPASCSRRRAATARFPASDRSPARSEAGNWRSSSRSIASRKHPRSCAHSGPRAPRAARSCRSEAAAGSCRCSFSSGRRASAAATERDMREW